MPTRDCIDRRQFMAAASVAGLAALTGTDLAPWRARGRRVISPGGMLNHASIGVGGMGAHDLQTINSHDRARIVAICDVDKNHLDKATEWVPDARKYTDWREMLAEEGDKIDSVNVSVPDHMHAMITLAALDAGKHVYCQKPLCHDVTECRTVAKAAKKHRAVTQLGTQAASFHGDLTAVQYLRHGVLGRVKKVIVCSNRPGAIEAYRAEGPRPDRSDPVPATLAWNLWEGTAPERPFVNGVYHPTKWRGWLDFGTGWLGDIGCHVFDSWWKGIQPTAPRTVVAEVQQSWRASPERRADTWPQSAHITWVFPGNAASGGEDFTVDWYDGLMFPPEEAQQMAKAAGLDAFPFEGSMVVGEEGAMLLPNCGEPSFSPSERFEGIEQPEVPQRDHYHHFVDACLGGEPTESFFEATGPMAETILLGTVAIRMPDTELRWNAKRMRIPNAPDAEALLRRDYREF